MTRILVFGGRDFNDREYLFAELDLFDKDFGVTVVIEGEARGADQLAANWAAVRGKQLLPFPADWARHGKSAGPRRNQQMLDEGRPDYAIGFPGGRGTADMSSRAARALGTGRVLNLPGRGR